MAFFLASLGDLGWGANVARQKAAETPHGMQAFPLAQSRFALVQPAIPQMPLTVVGPRGALLGQQNGVFESWIFPDKIFNDFRISARLKDYPVPIDVNRLASVVDVEPDHTTITYSHAAFTVRQIMFAPRHAANGTGVVVLFQIDSVRPLQLTFSFTPEVKRAWPAPNYGPTPEWVTSGDGGGHYILHTDSAGLAAGLEMPGAHPGILAPYQERPHSYPLQFVLDFDPGTDRGLYFPLLMAVGNTAAMATSASLEADLQTLDRNMAQIYRDTASYHSDFFNRRLTIETPDPKLDLAYRWALIAMDDDRIRLYTDGEMGLAAGFYPSGDSARPGFGWFFGRDSLWTVYALDAEGDFSTAREAMLFLLNRQRPDGKVMHEYAQTAETVDWKSLPYEYAAADATPLLLMAAADYVSASDDTQFLRDHWPQFQKAWQCETGHDSRDGIYNNSNGTGWVESWPGGMPQQEIYLAALDVQASTAMGRLAAAEGDGAVLKQARTRAAQIGAIVQKEYALDSGGFYAFSRNANGSLDKTATIYPTVAWWDGTYSLPKADAMFSRWASKEFSTDWGTRDISEGTPFYDPISYHQGSVWPLFTGWTSLAEYRTGRTLSGYAHLMQNANLTFAQDLGAVTELLSGAFYQTLGRSTSHQLWSSAMVVSPLLRGMFGLQWDAAAKTLYVTPHLPPCWDHATLHHVSLGQSSFDLDFRRDLGQMDIAARGDMHGIRLASHATGAQVGDKGDSLRIPLPPVEVQIPSSLPEPGSRTSMVKVLAETWGQHSLRLLLEGQGGSTISMPLRRNGMGGKIAVHGGVLKNNSTGQLLWVQFPDGVGYQQRQLDVAW